MVVTKDVIVVCAKLCVKERPGVPIELHNDEVQINSQ